MPFESLGAEIKTALDLSKIAGAITGKFLTLEASVEMVPTSAADCFELVVTMIVLERDDGTPLPIQKGCFVYLPASAHEVISRVHDVMRELAWHEVAEGFKFNNVRVFDPHAA